MKYALLLALLAVALLGSTLHATLPQDRTEWIVVFEVKQKNAGVDPVARINVIVRGHTEGEVAIKAHDYIQGMFRKDDRLTYIEAGLKK